MWELCCGGRTVLGKTGVCGACEESNGETSGCPRNNQQFAVKAEATTGIEPCRRLCSAWNAVPSRLAIQRHPVSGFGENEQRGWAWSRRRPKQLPTAGRRFLSSDLGEGRGAPPARIGDDLHGR